MRGWPALVMEPLQGGTHVAVLHLGPLAFAPRVNFGNHVVNVIGIRTVLHHPMDRAARVWA